VRESAAGTRGAAVVALDALAEVSQYQVSNGVALADIVRGFFP
jgi:hypothetical protein